jgi:transcriptional regulator GlxA family with amidase domain
LVDDHNDLVHLRVDTTFADVPRPDVLLAPGGPVAAQYAAAGHPIIDWIRRAHPHTAWTTSVCTGALLLGAAGLLDGVPATTHWSAYDALASYGAQPTEQRVVTSGRIVTGAGVSAGVDLALTLAAKIAGPEVAQSIQLAIEYDPQPPFDADSRRRRQNRSTTWRLRRSAIDRAERAGTAKIRDDSRSCFTLDGRIPRCQAADWDFRAGPDNRCPWQRPGRPQIADESSNVRSPVSSSFLTD